MKKLFDCVEMKRKAQTQVYDETRGLSRKEQIAYFHEAGERFWHDIQTLRRKGCNRKALPKRKTHTD